MAKSMLKDFRISGDVIDAVSGVVARQEAEAYVAAKKEGGLIPEEGPSESVTLQAIVDSYERNLASSVEAKAFLERSGVTDWTILRRLGAGYCDGTLSERLSARQRAELSQRGVLTKGGDESLSQCVTLPLFDAAGAVVGIAGIPVAGGTERVIGAKGLVNRAALAVWREEIILTETVLDAVSLLSMGIERVLPCIGEDGDASEERAALKEAGVSRVVIAFSTRDAGRAKAKRLSGILTDEGFSVAEIACEDGDSWSEALRAGTLAADVETLIREASFSAGAAREKWEWNARSQRWELTRDGLVYKAMGSVKRIGTSMRLSVRMEKDGKRYLDHVDLYSARSRLAYREQGAAALNLEGAVIEQDLLSLLDQLESEAEADESAAPTERVVTEEEAALALTLLESDTIFEDIVRDMDAIGHVGEDENKLLVYLAASSRKLMSPVSVVVTSVSAAGKSFLIDTVRRLMPEEDVVNLTSLSDQALNYMTDGSLMHKLLILGEAVHNEVVEHQIREMLSARCLSRMVVTKDERTGKLASALVRQEAVVSLMMSTTRFSMNEENASRYLLIHADESDEQTKRIHERQNASYTLEAMRRNAEIVPAVIRKHQAAQRLLKSVVVVNPYTAGKEFPYRLMRSRRDNKQLQDLIASVCFLRQYRKEKRRTGGITYIECDATDVSVAWNLFRKAVMKASYLELPESMVRLYEDIRSMCREIASESGISSEDVKFDQGQVRRKVHYLGAESVKKYIHKLVGLEYLGMSGTGLRGQRARYQLIADESLESLAGFGDQDQ
ncbi:MAG TPA: toprim domain-containing protein [Treponemataceae bacterium]|mgnify:CR=1 FL=1|nr:toprim domain-containing protein [Treponemataceae bacterium]